MKRGRENDRVRRIAIGGKDELGRQRYAVPLDNQQEPLAAEPKPSLHVDWEGIAREVKLSRVERSVFLGLWTGEGTPSSLGLTRHQAAAATREITKKLQEHREAIWPYIQELSATELFLQKSWSTSRNQRNLKNIIEGGNQMLDELQEKLSAERSKAQRISLSPVSVSTARFSSAGL